MAKFMETESRLDFPGDAVKQWIGIRPPMQGTQVQSLVHEDSTCLRATKPVHHNYWVRVPRAHAPQQEKPEQWEAMHTTTRVAPNQWG